MERKRYSIVELGALAYAIRMAVGMTLGGIMFIVFAAFAQHMNDSQGFNSDPSANTFSNFVRGIGIFFLVVGIVTGIVSAIYIAKRRDEGASIADTDLNVNLSVSTGSHASMDVDSTAPTTTSPTATPAEDQSTAGTVEADSFGQALLGTVEAQEAAAARQRRRYGRPGIMNVGGFNNNLGGFPH